MTIILVAFIAFLTTLILFITRVIDTKENQRTKKFRRWTSILCALTFILTLLPYIIVNIEQSNNNRKVLQGIADDLSRDYDIAHKWKFSIEEGFPDMEAFSKQVYTSGINYIIQDTALSEKLKDAYIKLEDVDLRLQDFRTGMGFKMNDEVRRINKNLDELIVKIRVALMALRNRDIKINSKIGIDTDCSTEDTNRIFKIDFDNATLSRDVSMPPIQETK